MEKELISKEICMTKDIGLHGNLFGGIMLSFIDKAGAIFASEKCASDRVVTLSMDKVLFRKTVQVNDILHFYGKIIKFGNSSFTFKIEVVRKDRNGEEEVVCETSMVFVKIDSDGKPSVIESKYKNEFLGQ